MSRVLVLGKNTLFTDDIEPLIDEYGIEIVAATDMEGLEAVFEEEVPSAVIIGSGIDQATCMEAMGYTFAHSHTTSVHMKARTLVKGGILPFVRAMVPALYADLRDQESSADSASDDQGSQA